ncbi:hypothetical protein BC835DRAFT_1260603 [Cytidiella melzeri]|nr:hypothetical protein BC835DRAFT_1260603 [Cytidiella melzeri]
MADYDFRPGGSLKLKGGVVDGGIVKNVLTSECRKKKSKSKSKDSGTASESTHLKELEKLMEDERKSSSPGPSSSKPAVSSDRKTAAEKRFEEVQKKRLADRVARMATKSHKDRVSEFNNKLEALSEHHDIPKVRFLCTQ